MSCMLKRNLESWYNISFQPNSGKKYTQAVWKVRRPMKSCHLWSGDAHGSQPWKTWKHKGSKRFTRVTSQKFNPGAILVEACGRRGAPQRWVYCPPTEGRGHGRVLPPSAFLLMTSKTTHSAIYKGDTRGPDTEAPLLEAPGEAAALPQALGSLSDHCQTGEQ